MNPPELNEKGGAKTFPAIDQSAQGHGLGGQLLLAAGRCCLYVAAKAGGVALLINAKNERVAKWYASYGAVPLLDAQLFRTKFELSFRAARLLADNDSPAERQNIYIL